MNENMAESRYVFVQAHRGYSSRYPEQTMLAFRKAVETGADRLEMDLSLSADGEVVLLHDSTVDRTTNGSGPIAERSLSELRELDAGSWKDPDFAGERIPTLREVIAAVPESVALNLEIKVWQLEREVILRTLEAGVALVSELGALDRVVFSSFSIEALLRVRSLEPEARLLLLDWSDPRTHDGLDIAIENRLFAWSTRPMYATRDRVERAAAAGLSSHIGGVSLDQSTLDFIEWGVSGLSADDPESLITFLTDEGFRSQRPEARQV